MSLIVADVGGTNARLAFQKNIHSEIGLIENFLCSEFKSLEDIIAIYKQKYSISNDHRSIIGRFAIDKFSWGSEQTGL